MTHSDEIKKPSTSVFSDLYCVSHCVLSDASVGAAWPLAGFGAIDFW